MASALVAARNAMMRIGLPPLERSSVADVPQAPWVQAKSNLLLRSQVRAD